MIVDLQERNWNLPKDLLTLQSNYPYPKHTTTFMEARVRRTMSTTIGATNTRATGLGKGLKGQEHHHYGQGNKRKIKKKGPALRVSYFSSESMALLICLTASLLFLPLVLPPLPPPPFLLLLLPICILGLLMILAFMPSNVRDLAYM